VARLAAFALTFLSIVVAWVFFRADDINSAIYVLSKMTDPAHIALGRAEIADLAFVAAYATLAWLAPNTQQIMGYDHANRTVGSRGSAWRPRPLFLYATAAVFAFGILGIQQHSEFIYFRF
jgi:alginate O-acetyltransferase complex protein AlgI